MGPSIYICSLSFKEICQMLSVPVSVPVINFLPRDCKLAVLLTGNYIIMDLIGSFAVLISIFSFGKRTNDATV